MAATTTATALFSGGATTRWAATTASICIQITTGGSYAFSIYSPILKSSQNYDQSTLDTISVFKDIGANAGVLSGLLYAAVVSTSTATWRRRLCGPWIVHVTGAAQCFIGYFCIWCAVVGVVSPPPVAVICLFMFLAAHAQTFFNTANVVSSVQNFPDYGGTIVGIMKGFLGLSGAVLIQVYQAFFDGQPSNLILMLALLPSIVAILLMCLVRVCPRGRVNDKKHLDSFSIVAVVLAAYLMIIIILESLFLFPHWAHIVTILILVLLLSSPIKITIDANNQEKSQGLPTERDPLTHGACSNESDQFADKSKGDYDELPSTSDAKVLKDGGNGTISEALCSLNFLFLFISMACGMGSGLATINNMSQIGESLGYPRVKISTLVSLWSIWNFLGRFGAGYISDILLRRKGWPRPLVMVLTLATMSVGHIIIASGFPGNLYIGTILVGICYGSQWSLMPTITSEIFNVLHMGTIFNTIAIASPVGTYFLSVWVIGNIYDKEAGEANSCLGVHCFMVSFFILACVSFLGCLVSLALFFRTRAYYSSVVLRRLRHTVTG